MKNYAIIFLLLIVSLSSNSQNFVNGDLNGTAGTGNLPTGWTSVPSADINCIATGDALATPDVTNQLTPTPFNATPFSGTTFVCGLLSINNSGSVWHEGIQQTVSGFCVGCMYSVNFYQTLVRKAPTMDPSGSWSVIIDNTIADTSAPTTGFVSNVDLILNWELRSINFIATSTTHTIKFLPADDDTSWRSTAFPQQHIRMAIDSVFLSQVSIVLPIKLLSFTASQKNSNVILNWTTATEINNDFFTVEKSVNAREWIDVLKMPGAGNSSSNISYEATDPNPYNGISYYRLKQTDYDGQFSYSKTEIVDIRNFSAISIYPNPANDYLIVETNESINPRFTLYNMLGKTNIRSTKNSNNYILDTSDLSSGIYFLTIEQDGILLKKERIIIL